MEAEENRIDRQSCIREDIMEWKKENMPVIVVEDSGYPGVRKIADKVAEDIRRVIGVWPEVINGRELAYRHCEKIILATTLGKSPLFDELARWKAVDADGLYGEAKDGRKRCPKREVYLIRNLIPDREFYGVKEILLICGSDKRGTIYGMFSLSEYIGVSPLCYWGDVKPVQKDVVHIGKDIEIISREPSVRYRGFFINDEWPCFGTWVNKQFGGFNAEAYDKVFELLLRMKGNYLWPAMWSASFPLDGPGSANEELADLYGVVMGYSHHEPCLRASEEWRKVNGPDSRYGNDWNFDTNEQGLIKYWEDGLKRSGRYENIITIGMRGEYDSRILGPEASVAENVDLLKRIIVKQKELIRQYADRGGKKAALMFAVYKEVAAFFYGDGQTEGLKDWEELSDVILMLCEDNFGQTCALPTGEMRDHKGGFGMYYHLDYHGEPVSYEWIDSTPLSKVWEQMCQAYEYGIREMWIVNAGDLKFHEIPLTYFMALAYDYDKWGYGNLRSYETYTEQWVRQNFPAASPGLQNKIGRVLTDYIAVNALRRPEALHPGIYHPCHYGETDRMLRVASQVEELSCEVLESLQVSEKAGSRFSEAYYSMIHYPAMAGMNLLKMHLYAGKNHHYARQGRTVANVYGDRTGDCMRRDRELVKEWAGFLDGKWDGMQLAEHIGFTKWNEDDYRYPVVAKVEPAHKPRMSVSRKDEEKTAVKNYGTLMTIAVPDFQYAGCREVALEIANSGCGSLEFHITAEGTCGGKMPEWLAVTPVQGRVEQLQEVVLYCIREKLPAGPQNVRLIISDGDTGVYVDISAEAVETKGLPAHTFLARNGVITIGAEHFGRKKDVERGKYVLIPGYGKYAAGLKVFPSTASFGDKEDRPEVTYRFYLEEAGAYRVELITAPSNSVADHSSVNMMVQDSVVELLPADFNAGESSDARWSRGVLDQERRCSIILPFEKGVQELTLGALEPGVVLERILIHKETMVLPDSYLGPEESCMAGSEALPWPD